VFLSFYREGWVPPCEYWASWFKGDGGKLILLCKIIAVYIVFNTFYPGIEKHFMDTVSWVADGYQLLHTCFE
jgi:hypothetical protein